MLTKISSAQANDLLVKAANTIRSQNAVIADLEAKLAARDRHDHAEKIAELAVERGVLSSEEVNDYAEKLASSDKDLGDVEDLVKRSVTGVPLGQPMEKDASESDETSGIGEAEDRFFRGLLASEYNT